MFTLTSNFRKKSRLLLNNAQSFEFGVIKEYTL